MIEFQKYVIGVITCYETRDVLLIKKNKPDFQKGFFNFPGGKIEEGERPADAVSREIREETDLYIPPDQWKLFATMLCHDSVDNVSKGWIVFAFTVNLPTKDFICWQQMEVEQVHPFRIKDVTPANSLLLGNIAWLLGMAIDYVKNQPFYPVQITYNKLSLPFTL